MASVFLIWVGAYSDAQVIAAYPTSELADKAVDLMTSARHEGGAAIYGFEDARVQEIELNTIVPALHWFFCILDKDGAVLRETRGSSPRISADPYYTHHPQPSFVAYGTTPEHALKNAADFRFSWLASHPEVQF